MAYIPFSPQLNCAYTLTAPDGSKAVFNDPTDVNYVGMLFEMSGLDSPEIRENAQELVEADGGAHGNFFFGRRPITMSVRVFGHQTMLERETRLDRLRRVLHAGLRADLVLSWENDPAASFAAMQTWVRIQQPMRITGGWIKEAQIALVSQYAPLFSVNLKTNVVPINTLSGSASVENQGNWPAAPIYRFTGHTSGTLVNPSVYRFFPTETFKTVGLTVAANEQVEFDMLTHTGKFVAGARSGQSANRYIDYATTDWPLINPGGNNVGFNGTGTATVTVIWRDTWS